MKLGQAQKITSNRLQELHYQKRKLTELLKEDTSGGGSFDRLEISKELTAVEEEYEQTRKVAEHLNALSINIQNAEVTRQQTEAIVEATEDFIKILEVARRISKGDYVPAVDERKLLEYSPELYMAAKNMALLAQREEREKHRSLWEEEAPEAEPVDPAELAANTEVGAIPVQAAASGGAEGAVTGQE